jgi:uncharacterized protein YjlB
MLAASSSPTWPSDLDGGNLRDPFLDRSRDRKAVGVAAWGLTRRAGDVAIVPAGTGHQAVSATPDLLVVDAYPPSGTYDLCTSSDDHARAVKTVPKVGKPRKDPVYGHSGPLLGLWPSLRK